MLYEEATDWFAELISDSLEADWTSRDAARHIVAFMHSDKPQAADFRNTLAQIISQKPNA